jgi:hypothetical protein
MTSRTDAEARSYEGDQRDQRQDRRDDRQESAALISANTARIDALERWQASQDGSLNRLEAKFDAGSVRIDTKLDGLKMWMMSSLFTALLALAGIAFSMLASGGKRL